MDPWQYGTDRAFVSKCWNSVPRTMFSLYMEISKYNTCVFRDLGKDWLQKMVESPFQGHWVSRKGKIYARGQKLVGQSGTKRNSSTIASIGGEVRG